MLLYHQEVFNVSWVYEACSHGNVLSKSDLQSPVFAPVDVATPSSPLRTSTVAVWWLNVNHLATRLIQLEFFTRGFRTAPSNVPRARQVLVQAGGMFNAGKQTNPLLFCEILSGNQMHQLLWLIPSPEASSPPTIWRSRISSASPTRSRIPVYSWLPVPRVSESLSFLFFSLAIKWT